MKTFEENISFGLNNSYELLNFHDLTWGISFVETLSQKEAGIVVASLVVSFIVGSYYKSGLYGYMYAKRKELFDTPINILLLVQAIIQHLSCLLIVLTYTTALSLDITYAEHFGETWCNILFYGANFGAAYRIIGGFWIAVFRLTYLFNGAWLKETFGIKRMLGVIIGITLGLCGIMTVGFGMGNGPASRKAATMNFCLGKSELFREILHEYSLLRGTVVTELETIPKVVMLIALAFVLGELLCYMVFFGYILHHDQGIVKKILLEKEVIQRRHRKNAITFLGQFWTFVVELLMCIGIIFSMQKKTHIGLRLVVILGFWVEFGVVSVIEVMVSKSLTQYLPHSILFQ